MQTNSSITNRKQNIAYLKVRTDAKKITFLVRDPSLRYV